MFIIYKTIHTFFWVYSAFLMVRILSSWVPACQNYSWHRFVCFYTDPYLRVFQRIIPPIGGVLDISPMLAFFSLRIIESIVLALFR